VLLLGSMNLTKTFILGSILLCTACMIPAGKSLAQSKSKSDKVSHAEPLYLDLVRDLGARKGEKEINIAGEFAKGKSYNKYGLLAEYEFAPINRLGLEVEADFSFFKKNEEHLETPQNKLECLRFSAQYTFFVSTKLKTSLAVGYTQIFEFDRPSDPIRTGLVTGTVYNPFLVAAKRWGSNFHTVLYAYPLIERNLYDNSTDVDWQVNASFLYTIPQTKHFVGVEINQEIIQGRYEITARPQVKIKLNENLAAGLVAGIPLTQGHEGFSSFLRLIYEL
jgi:hypothetical protein